MKRLLCAFAAISLILAGCGNEPAESSVLIPDVGEAYVENTDESSDSGKKKKADDTEISEDSDSSTASTGLSESSTADSNNDDDSSRISDESSSVSNNGDSGNSDSDESIAPTVSKSKDETPKKTEKPKEVYYLEGIVYEVHDGSLLINETELRRVEVGFSDKKP